MVVDEIMSPKPIAVEANQTVREALRRLITDDIRHLPVVDDGVLVGMVSDRDVRGLASDVLSGNELTEQLARAVSEVMSSDLVTVDPETEIAEAIDLMIEHKIGALPVVSDTQLVGILSYVDVLRAARSALEE
jgi:acetoin utilization protein AcuB